MTTDQSVSRGTTFTIAEERASLRGRVVDAVREWRRRTRSRRELLTLDERDLRDVRLTRCDAASEASKPFWKK